MMLVVSTQYMCILPHVHLSDALTFVFHRYQTVLLPRNPGTAFRREEEDGNGAAGSGAAGGCEATAKGGRNLRFG